MTTKLPPWEFLKPDIDVVMKDWIENNFVIAKLVITLVKFNKDGEIIGKRELYPYFTNISLVTLERHLDRLTLIGVLRLRTDEKRGGKKIWDCVKNSNNLILEKYVPMANKVLGYE